MAEFELHNPTLNEEDEESINTEIKRLLKRHTAQKKLISREANKDPAKLRHEDREEYIERVEGAIKKLKAPLDLYDAIYQRLNHLYTLLEELHDPEAKDAAKIKEELSKEIGLLNDEQTKYEEEIHAPAHCTLRKILRDLKTQNGPSASTNSTATHSHASQKIIWKPKEHYKPPILEGPKEVTLGQLDDWTRRLRAYLHDHESQDIRDINIIVGDLIHHEVKGSIKFQPDGNVPIFGNESITSSLKEVWDRRNPLSVLRTKVFELNGHKHETYDQWQARCKQTFAKAELDKLDKDAIEGLIILMRFNGPKADEIREKIVTSEKFTNGNIHTSDVEAVAHSFEAAEAYNTKENNISQVNKVYGKFDKNDKKNYVSNKKKYNHEHLNQLASEGKCFSCAKKHEKGNRCNPDKFTCDFCKKKKHTSPACTYLWDKKNGKPDRLNKNKSQLNCITDSQQETLTETTQGAGESA